MQSNLHPQDPSSNVNKFGGYDPNKYDIDNVSSTVITHEDVTPGRPPFLTQYTIGKYLQPLTKELVEVPPRPVIDELPDAVIENMVKKDKAFWVDKPGHNAYTLHDAHLNYGMTAVIVKPTHQDVFPRSYQYDLDCVRYRRTHACDGMKKLREINAKPVSTHCRDCSKLETPGLSPFQLAWEKDPGQKRWKYYPDLSAVLSYKDIKEPMDEVGRPFKNEAINWYYKNYPPAEYNTIMRKFSK